MEDQKPIQTTEKSVSKKPIKLCRCGRRHQGSYNLCSPCLAKEDQETERAIEQWKFSKKRYW